MWTLIVRSDGLWKATGMKSRKKSLLEALALKLHAEQWRVFPTDEE